MIRPFNCLYRQIYFTSISQIVQALKQSGTGRRRGFGRQEIGADFYDTKNVYNYILPVTGQEHKKGVIYVDCKIL